MKKIKIGINGFGRIGRVAARIILEKPELSLVAINSRAPVSSHAYLLKYDSTYGTAPYEVKADKNILTVNKNKISVYAIDEPSAIPWQKEGVDIVIDATGKFRTTEDLKKHLAAGAKFVVLSAPAKDNTKTLVMGVNEKTFDPKNDKIVSNSSCTTNCLSTTLKVLHKNLGVKRGFMTTVHAVTDSQNLLDNSHRKEVRLRRSAFASMIPAGTGSAKDINKLYPELNGKIFCSAIRVPLLTVSLIILTVEVGKKTTIDQINNLYKEAAGTYLKGILTLAKDELVSRDFMGDPHASIVDPYLTQVVDGNLVNVYAWYDNEWGYTSRLIDMVYYIGRKAGLL